MSEERRLHPIALIKEFIIHLRKNIFPFVIIFLFGSGNRVIASMVSSHFLFVIVGALLFLFLPVLIKYFTFRYKLEEKGLRIRYGLIFLKNSYIPYERIQTVQQKQWFFFTPFNVVQILIETAGGKKVEANLSVVSKSVAQELKALRDKAHKKEQVKAGVEEENKVKTFFSNTDQLPEHKVVLKAGPLLFMAITSSSVFGGFLVLSTLFGQFHDSLPFDWLEKQFTHIWQKGVLIFWALLFFLLFIMWAISIISILLKYFQFELRKYEKTLVIEKGLLQRIHTIIHIERIQAVVVIESPLRQMMGFLTVKVITAGGSLEGHDSSEIVLLPIMKKQQAIEILKTILPIYQITEKKEYGAPKAALKRFLSIYLIWSIIPALVLFIFFYPLGLMGLFLPILACVKAFFSYRATAFTKKANTITLTARPFLSKKTYIARKERIQSLSICQSIWLKKHDLYHFRVAIKSGGGRISPSLRYMSKQAVNTLSSWYRPNLK